MAKFSLIDYIIIILVIIAVVFAFIHISSDDSSNLQKTAFDASTINKISDTYSNYYKDGYVVKSSVEGFNASNGEEIEMNGTVRWIDDNGGSDVKVLIDSGNKSYLVGMYKSVPNADIYINSISLESDGSKYDNLVEFSAKPKNITSFEDLEVPDNAEISTIITLDSIDEVKIQELTNKLNENGKRVSIKTANTDLDNQIVISKATNSNINDADSVFGTISGISDDITIRAYNLSDSQIKEIESDYDIVNVREF